MSQVDDRLKYRLDQQRVDAGEQLIEREVGLRNDSGHDGSFHAGRVMRHRRVPHFA